MEPKALDVRMQAAHHHGLDGAPGFLEGHKHAHIPHRQPRGSFRHSSTVYPSMEMGRR